jgi:flavodoxin
MKTLVIYYSYTGKTKRIAEDLAKKESADLIEVKEKKPRSKFNAYVFGSFAARGQKQAELQPFSSDFSAYDKIIIAMPIWAGYPAPAMNTIISLLPKDKKIELIMTSGSGSSQSTSEKTKALIEAKGCTVIKYEDIKA